MTLKAQPLTDSCSLPPKFLDTSHLLPTAIYLLQNGSQSRSEHPLSNISNISSKVVFFIAVSCVTNKSVRTISWVASQRCHMKGNLPIWAQRPGHTLQIGNEAGRPDYYARRGPSATGFCLHSHCPIHPFQRIFYCSFEVNPPVIDTFWA